MKPADSGLTTTAKSKSKLTLEDLAVDPPMPSAADWNEYGFVIKEGLLPDYMMEPYERCWLENNQQRPGGWPDCTPYMRHRELLDLCSFSGIHQEMARLLGEPAGVHLNLTGWESTTRDWHQDTYLNPPHVGDYYCAVWMALADITPEMGPFQCVPGSHRWPVVTQEKILNALDPSERDHRWPTFSERILTPIFEAEIKKRKASIYTYLPKRGDVLFWHGRLVHRGSIPRSGRPYPERRALISHYSGIHHRKDMPDPRRHLVSSAVDGWFFPLSGSSNIR